MNRGSPRIFREVASRVVREVLEHTWGERVATEAVINDLGRPGLVIRRLEAPMRVLLSEPVKYLLRVPLVPGEVTVAPHGPGKVCGEFVAE